LKKNFLLRIDEEVFNNIKDISEKEDRSINYMINKLINKGLNYIELNEELEKDIEIQANKRRMSKNELITQIWNAYKKTFI
jgi:predicted HicB family RNase H-like nuclease